MRLRNVQGAKERLVDSSVVINNPISLKGSWNKVFKNDNDIYIEVGMGKGQFITQLAKAYPDRNFIGIEKYDSVLIRAVEKLEEENIPNLFLIRFDATELLDIFEQGEISGVYLNFSDPWPKNRHEKRRLTSHIFLNQYKQLMKCDGKIEFKTDNQGLFEFSLISLNSFGAKLELVSLDLHKSDIKENYMTEYEEKFSKKGQRIYKLEAKL